MLFQVVFVAKNHIMQDKFKSTYAICVLILLVSSAGSSTEQKDSSRFSQCNASTVFTGLYWECPPFTISRPYAPSKGIMLELLDELLYKCCHPNATVTFPDKRNRPSSQFGVLEKYENENFVFPIKRTLVQHVFELEDPGVKFLQVLESPGAFYLVLDNGETETKDEITAIVLGAWPLLLVIFLTANFAGMAIWILERFRNADQFPRAFLQGYWEGFWWAFVTMTTVGYGDRVPRSVPARVFTVLWILLGMVLLACFTATMTTALSTNKMSDFRYSINGEKVAVLQDTEDMLLAISEGANPSGCRNRVCLIDKLHNGSVDGILLEHYIALDYLKLIDHTQNHNHSVHKYHKGGTAQHDDDSDENDDDDDDDDEDEPKPPLQVDLVIPQHAVYGILMQNIPEDLAQCFARAVRKERYNLITSLQPNHKKMTYDPIDISSSILKTDNTVTFLAVGWGLWAALFIGLIFWEVLYWRPKHKLQGTVIKNAHPSLCRADTKMSVYSTSSVEK